MALFSYYLLKDTQRNGFAWMLVIVTDDRQLGQWDHQHNALPFEDATYMVPHLVQCLRYISKAAI